MDANHFHDRWLYDQGFGFADEADQYRPATSTRTDPPKARQAMTPPIPITTTKQVGQRDSLTILVYGSSGAGKTYMSRTTGDLEGTLVLTAEGGMLSLADVEIPCAEISSIDQLRSMYAWLRRGDHGYRWLIIDSISEIAEQVLAKELDANKDGRKAYGEMQDTICKLLKHLRDLPMNVVLIAKREQIQDEDGKLLYGPSFPGKRLAQLAPYLFDEVWALRTAERTDDDGKPVVVRYLQTVSDGRWEAKDRSGRLERYERPDLKSLADKLLVRTPALVNAQEDAA